jgi:predicted lipoprotein with Yx(FWY)xxD motif
MNRRHILALGGAMAAFALAACGGGDKGGDTAKSDTAASPVTAPDTGSVASATQGGGVKPLDTTAAAVQGGVEITVDSAAGMGQFLADKTGRPLYMYTGDKSGQPTCAGGCAQLWPAVVGLQGTASAGSTGVQSSMLGTVKRTDGSAQITYNGHPLYYYSKDQGGTAPQGNDQKDAGGEWYLVTPQGEKMEHGEHKS